MPTTDRRYPLGTRDEQPAYPLEALIGHIRQLPSQLEAALAQASPAGLQATYREGSWTVLQLLHHLADAGITFYHRSKLAIATPLALPRPLAVSYNDQAFLNTPETTTTSPETCLQLLHGLHTRYADMLAGLDDEALEATLQNANGSFTDVQAIARYAAWHSRHHTAHIHLALGLPILA